MEWLVHLSWRLYLALPLMGVGVVIAVQGARRGQPALMSAVRGDPSELVRLMQGFRSTVIGLALVGLGAAWIWQLGWLLIVSLAVACGETMETALVIYALRHGSDVKIGTRQSRYETRHRPLASSC